MIGDIVSAAVHRGDNAEQFERLQSLPYDGAGDAEHLRQPALGRERITRLECSVLDVFDDLIYDIVGGFALYNRFKHTAPQG